MKKLQLVIACILICLFASKTLTLAASDPRDVPNNIYGIHITDDADLEDARNLVNSSGGDWGYVTIVIREDDRDVAKWQRTFDQMRQMHLIPLVRIATKADGAVWKKPFEHEIGEWMGFLQKLRWVTKNRYIILFNEPNHAKEWGGEINPEEFAKMQRLFRDELKKNSDDYFILPGALDLAPGNTGATMHPATFYQRMYDYDNAIFTIYDGWASHAYANPAFSGSVDDTGRLSIRGYEWEVNLLQQFGLPDNLPIFITETGWVHNQGTIFNRNYISPEQVAKNFEFAFQEVWSKNNQIVAVTPFILRYEAPPFDHFSWKKIGEDAYHPKYEAVQKLSKVAANPVQIHDSEDTTTFLPSKLVVDSNYRISIRFKNTGQSIWNPEDVELRVEGIDSERITIGDIHYTEPGQEGRVWLELDTASDPYTYNMLLYLQHQGTPFGEVIEYPLQLTPEIDFFTPIKLFFERIFHPQTFLGLA